MCSVTLLGAHSSSWHLWCSPHLCLYVHVSVYYTMRMNCLPLQVHLLLVVIHLWVLSFPVALPPQLLIHHVCVTCLTVCVLYMILCFLPTAPLVNVVPVVVGVVSGLIIATVVVVTVCLLIVVKHKHRRNQLTIFYFTSRFFYRYVEKKDLKVKQSLTILEHFVLLEFEFH